MIELRNKQYMTIIDCIAGAALEQGQVITLADHGDVMLRALAATSSGDVSAITGPLLAHWISDRSTAVGFELDDDGYTLNVVGATDDDATHYIPSGTRMLAVGGKGVAEVRLFKSSLDAEFATTLPAIGTTLEFASDTSKLCSQGHGHGTNLNVAYVLENDGVSIAVLLG